MRFGDVEVNVLGAYVALIELRRPPHNFFSLDLLHDLVLAVEWCDHNDAVRAAVLAAEGKNFCAGAAFDPGDAKLSSATSAESVIRGADGVDLTGRHIYDEAVGLFSTRTPLVAAVAGAAIGGGLGLAAAADFRVGGPSTRLSANFARLGFHHGFGLTVTLPALVGSQRALELLYTGARLDGQRGAEIGLLDRFVPDENIRSEAIAFATDIAASAPLAVDSIRQTMRGHLADAVRAATDREKAEQERLTQTNDWQEGVRATAERRPPNFTGR